MTVGPSCGAKFGLSTRRHPHVHVAHDVLEQARRGMLHFVSDGNRRVWDNCVGVAASITMSHQGQTFVRIQGFSSA